MAPNRKHATPVSEDTVRRIANIVGSQSAAQQALDRAAELRAEGVEPAFWEAGSTLIVGPKES